MLLKKAGGVSCCDIAAETRDYLPINKKTGTCHAEKNPTALSRLSPCQTARRNAYKALTNLWNTLSAGQKTGWDTLAQATAFVNDCGETYYISAFNMFSKVNGVLINFGSSYMLATAPGSYTPPGSGVSYFHTYATVSYSTHKPLWFMFTPVTGQGVQIFSFKGAEVPTSMQEKYYKFLVAGITETDV